MALSQVYQNAYSQAKASGDTAMQQRYENIAKTLGTTVTNPTQQAFSNNVQNGSALTAPSGLPQTVSAGTSNVQPVANPTNASMPTYNAPAQYKSTFDPTAYINQLSQAKLQQNMSALEQARNNTLSDLNAQKTTTTQQYAGQRDSVGTQSMQQARNFAEYMARRGQTQSGVNAQMELARNVALQNNLGALRTAESNALSELGRRESLANSNYESGVVQAKAGAEAEKMRALIDAMSQQENWNRQDYQNALSQASNDYTRNYNAYRDSIGDNRYNTEYANRIKQQELDNYVKSITGLGDSFDYQAEINKLQNDNDPTNDNKIPYLMQARQEKISAINKSKAEAAKMANDKAQQDFENNLKLRQLALEAERNAISRASKASSGSGSGSSASQIKSAKEAEYNSKFAKAYSTFKSYPVEEAKRLMNTNSEEIISNLGSEGFKDLWNAVMNDAIAMGQALPYGTKPSK